VAGRYKIEFLPSAARELEALPREAQGRVADAIEALADEPRPSAAKLLSGTGRERIWRILVGQYRVLYQVTDVRITVAIVRIADRREVYNALLTDSPVSLTVSGKNQEEMCDANHIERSGDDPAGRPRTDRTAAEHGRGVCRRRRRCPDHQGRVG
jgi:mRNA interferase RelE/StbE